MVEITRRTAAAGIALVVLVAGCGDSVREAGESTVTFLHFNDLHAHLTPHLDWVPDGPPGEPSETTRIALRDGIARLATLVDRIRRETPGAILMNIGDTYHGGVEALFTVGNAIAAPVNALGIDVGVPGNWDFAFGPGVTRLRYRGESLPPPLGFEGTVERPNFPNLAANVVFDEPGREGEPFLPPTLLLERGGVRIGFIGLTSDIVPRMLASGLDFLQGESAYKALVDRHAAALRAEGAQIVVVMSELGVHKDHRLAQVIAPGVDVIFSAHTHEVTAEPLTSASGAIVVEAGNDGYLGRMDVTLRDRRVVRRRWRLFTIDPGIPPDPAMEELVVRARVPFLAADVDMEVPLPFTVERLREPIDTVLGTVPFALDRRGALESSFNDLFTDALREMSGADVAITPGFRFDAVSPAAGDLIEGDAIASGQVTLEDAYRFFPIPVTLSVGESSGRNLREVIEGLLERVFSDDAFRQAGGWVDGFAGLNVEVDLARADGRRVVGLTRQDTGEPLGDDDIVRVAGCSRPVDSPMNLCSHPGFARVSPLGDADGGEVWTPVRLLAAALEDGIVVEPSPAFHDRSARPRWPVDAFVQPLPDPGGRGEHR